MSRSHRWVFSLLVFSMSGACGGGSSTDGGSGADGGSGTNGVRDCDSVRSDYTRAATGSSATACAGPAGGQCDIHFGLCTPSGGLVRGNARGVYNSQTAARLQELEEEWKQLGCAGRSCQGSAGGTIGCIDNVCSST